ncbi:hypothetical protein VJI72_08945, partial [Parvimonas micra]|uniref:hypothetical protein n=1 Tax=Parvimonas micra TaxID=33033 RepID=UPI002B466D7F
LDARGRIALERSVADIALDLDAAAELFELLDRAEIAPTSELAFSSLARESAAVAFGVRPSARVELSLDLASADCTVVA